MTCVKPSSSISSLDKAGSSTGLDWCSISDCCALKNTSIFQTSVPLDVLPSNKVVNKNRIHQTEKAVFLGQCILAAISTRNFRRDTISANDAR